MPLVTAEAGYAYSILSTLLLSEGGLSLADYVDLLSYSRRKDGQIIFNKAVSTIRGHRLEPSMSREIKPRDNEDL